MIKPTAFQNIRIAMDKVWSIGKETYVRLYPNPGFAIVIKKRRLTWSIREGWKYGSVR